MKHPTSNIQHPTSTWLGLGLLIGLLGMMGVTGCGTTGGAPTTREAAIYFTFHDIKTMADAAEKVYGNQVVLGHVGEDRQREIDAQIVELHAKFKLALRIARLNYNTTAPAELQALASEFVLIVNSLGKGK